MLYVLWEEARIMYFLSNSKEVVPYFVRSSFLLVYMWRFTHLHRKMENVQKCTKKKLKLEYGDKLKRTKVFIWKIKNDINTFHLPLGQLMPIIYIRSKYSGALLISQIFMLEGTRITLLCFCQEHIKPLKSTSISWAPTQPPFFLSECIWFVLPHWHTEAFPAYRSTACWS